MARDTVSRSASRRATEEPRTFTIAVVLAASLLTFSCSKSEGSGSAQPVASTGVASPSSSAVPRPAVPMLPAENAPPLASKASEAPALEGELLGDPRYVRVWDGKHDAARDILLTAVSHGLISETQETGDMSLTQAEVDALKREKLDHAFIKLASYLSRTGSLPADFVGRTRAILSAGGALPYDGTWLGTPGKPPPEADFAALAYWLNPSDARRLRVFITTRSIGSGWQNAKGPTRPYLARERIALRRLSTLANLSTAEQARLAELDESAHHLGDEPPEMVELRQMLHEYGSNEVRADDRFRGHVIEFSGVAGSVERGTIGGITLDVGTGADFERPTVRCYFDEVQTAKVKAINRGDRVTVRGVVNGLAVVVMVDHCELAH